MDEENLTGYGYAFEQHTKIREKMRQLIRPSADSEDVLQHK